MFFKKVLLNFFICSAFSLIYERGQYIDTDKISVYRSNGIVKNLIINGVISKPKPFFARLHIGSAFCGASILTDRFVLTASHCVSVLFFVKPENLYLEVGDFTNPSSIRRRYDIDDFFVPDMQWNEAESILALVKTSTSIDNWNNMYLPINVMSVTRLGSCGMGSVSTQPNNLLMPTKLQE
ncbi:testisin-like isoform X1 [Convolutriloba macropyga]|uniref:testisin-like isoform X1 n=1 Tax=Convolutriloba macropyga TaxID=536237 RepID=UPI003F526E90